MSSIVEFIRKIREARLGKDVRESIAKAIEQTYEDASKSGNSNMEVSEARGEFETLSKRLNNSDKLKADKDTVELEVENRKKEDNNLQSQINGLASGSPLVANSVSDMKDISKTYVNTNNGHWYYYNGSSWSDGGVYQATEIPESTITAEKTVFAKRKNLLNPSKFQIKNSVYIYEEIDVRGHSEIYYFCANKGCSLYFKNENLSDISNIWIKEGSGSIDVPTDASYVVVRTLTENDGINIAISYEKLERFVEYKELDIDLKVNNDLKKENEKIQYSLEKIKKAMNEIYSTTAKDITWKEGYLNQNGSTTESDNYQISDYLEVSEGEKYRLISSCEYNTRIYALYNKNKQIVDIYPKNNQTIGYEESIRIEIPKNVNFLRIGKIKNKETYLYELLKYEAQNEKYLYNALYGKIILFAGDSITYGAGNTRSENDWSTKGWRKIIQENNPCAITYGYGVGGSTIAKREDRTDSILERINKMYTEHSNADYIILQGGINDYWSKEIEIGEVTDSYDSQLDERTFCGAMESMLKKASLNWKGKKIGFICTFKTPAATDFRIYMNKAMEICKKWSVPYLDLFDNSGLNLYLPEIATLYTKNGDKTHPTDEGYEIITPKIENWIKTL